MFSEADQLQGGPLSIALLEQPSVARTRGWGVALASIDLGPRVTPGSSWAVSLQHCI